MQESYFLRFKNTKSISKKTNDWNFDWQMKQFELKKKTRYVKTNSTF